MTISERITQARHDHTARRAIRAERATLVRELSYSTPADRSEIQLMARRSPHPEAAEVLDILDQLTLVADREDIRRTA